MIDTHTHVISADYARYPSTPAPASSPTIGYARARSTYPQLLAEMDTAGVHGAVLVQARGGYGYDNSYVADARSAAPSRLVNAAVIDMRRAGSGGTAALLDPGSRRARAAVVQHSAGFPVLDRRRLDGRPRAGRRLRREYASASARWPRISVRLAGCLDGSQACLLRWTIAGSSI